MVEHLSKADLAASERGQAEFKNGGIVNEVRLGESVMSVDSKEIVTML